MTPAKANTTRTPLLSAVANDAPTAMGSKTSNTTATTNNTNEQELQFYDPATVLNVPREVAFGYLILLTGGSVEYEAPTPEEVSSSAQPQQPRNEPRESSSSRPEQASQPQSKDESLTPALDEESASLAYAAIVDGNVLHACFGLRAAPNGRVDAAPDALGGGKGERRSIFCCLPASPATIDALQLVLPRATVNKLRMRNLAEILGEVRELHYEALATGEDPFEVSLYARVIRAYIRCFTAVVRYHDAREHLERKKGNRKRQGGAVTLCSKLFRRCERLLSRRKDDPRLEQLRANALRDIEDGFQGVREGIWEGLERMTDGTAGTAFTGVSVEE